MSRIKILNASLVEIGIIRDVFSAGRTEKLNSDNILTFTAPLTPTNTALINGDNVAEVDEEYFDIVYYQKGQSSSGELTVSVECEHVSYRLNEPVYDMDFFTRTGTPEVILGYILAGTGFTVGTVEFTAEETYSAQEKKSRRQLLMEFVDYLGGEVEFNKFQVSIRQHRGSTIPKDLTAGRNIEIISKTYNKREKDADGNPLVSYACKLIRPMAISLGDVVSLDYATLDIDIQLRVVSLTTNPYNQYEAEFEIGNFIPGLADDAYRIATSTVGKGKTYYGVRISPENGFESVRSDKMARGIFNADTFALQAGDGSGSNWTNKIYFDSAAGKYVFDGVLTAETIEASNIEVDVNVTQILYAGKGNISELTVDQLDTSTMVAKYLAKDTSNVGYIKVFGRYIQFIEASTDGSQTAQVLDRHGRPMYWTDETYTSPTLEETAYPILVYVYTEQIKMELFNELDPETGYYVPKMIWGVGGGIPGREQGVITKDEEGLLFSYISSRGMEYALKLGERGISLGAELFNIEMYTDGMVTLYEDGSMNDWSFTKDSNGRIIQINNNTLNKFMTINWNNTPKPSL